MLKGLQLAGKNPTLASTIKASRGIKSYNGNGLPPSSIDYTTIFGHNLPKGCCGWFLKAETNGFEGRDQRIRPGLEPAHLWHRPSRDEHRQRQLTGMST